MDQWLERSNRRTDALERKMDWQLVVLVVLQIAIGVLGIWAILTQ